VATIPTTPLTPAQVAASIGASPTQPQDPNVQAALVGGQSGLTPATLNALLSYQSDITQAGTDVTAANAQGRTDTLAATQAGYQADVYGLQGQSASAQGDVYGLQGQQALDDQTAYGLQAQKDAAEASVYGLEAQQGQADQSVYGLKATADASDAAGFGLQATGYGKEIDAYNTAAGISAENAALAVMSGNVTKAQEQRNITQTLGTQRAQIAGAGFSGDSGTALALYRDSVGQGNLQLAMTDLQTNINQGSYLEAAQASKAMAEAVGVAKTGAETAQTNALTQQQEDLVAQGKAGLGVQADLAAQTEAGLTQQEDQVAADKAGLSAKADIAAQGQQQNAVQQAELARQGSLAAENTYNTAASTDAQAAQTAAQTASTAQVNMTNLVNTISNTGVGTTTGTPGGVTRATSVDMYGRPTTALTAVRSI
jgi:hypothetical protein